jgi:photosystem II stability/assembly factor-like uncharacterized protein
MRALTWLVLLQGGPLPAAEPLAIEPFLNLLPPRALGPANMSGRITDVAVVESRPTTMYVASASGGVWKTVNNGITWTPIFDNQPVASIGDVTVAPSNPNIVWVGTGEANPRNSVSWGNGVYRSQDGGKSWTHVGLRETHHISRIIIHPTDPNVVYVAALGRVWGPNPERGVFKTEDGGKSWRQVHFLDADTGCIDLAMDPADPNILYAAMYRVRRDGFSGGNPAVMFGNAAGLYRTEDAGKTWTRLAHGLPDRPFGRCGIDVWRKDPNVVYAVIQTDRTDIKTTPGQPARPGGPVETGGIFRSTDRGQTWTKLNDLCPRPFYYGQIRIDPNNDQRIYVLGIELHISDDGGKNFRSFRAPGVHVDHHALWINPHDSDHLVLGNDGGLCLSYDRGANWQHVKNLPLAQFYAVGVDMRRPYRIYGGLQDNGSWGGPSATRSLEGGTLADWSRILGFDGYYCQIDPTDPDTVYAEGQYGLLRRINVRTGATVDIRPRPGPGMPAYRFNWSAPILLSSHNPRLLYYGGNFVFRSLDRGDHWQTISPDLTRLKPGPSGNTGHTISVLAESPLRPGLLWAGTDDGKVHVTSNGGATWTDLSATIPGLPQDRWISRIECSRFAEATAYLAIDRHRNDDRAPYLFKTTDLGQSWQSLSAGLPAEGPVHVIREDPRQRDLLYAGTEFGLFISADGGQRWQRLAGLPTVAVHDLVIHPRDRELVIATHGRGLYVMDVTPLQELSAKVLAEDAYLFDVKPAVAFDPHGYRNLAGGGFFTAANPPYGTPIYYYLKSPGSEPVQLTVHDATGKLVAELKAPRQAGLHRVQWDLRASAQAKPKTQPTLVSAGDYALRLTVGQRQWVKPLRVEGE